MTKLLELINNKNILVADGAWGTMIFKKGLKPGECPEEWNLIRSEDVKDIASQYISAGSDIISTNSFGGSRIKLLHYGLDEKVKEINNRAAEISKEAAIDRCVMGSIGPTGKILFTGEVSQSELIDGFAEQASALIEGGVDFLSLETFYDLDEITCAIEGIRQAVDTEIICSCTFNLLPNGEIRTMMGNSVEEVVSKLISLGADVIGTNCGFGFEQSVRIIKEFRNVSQQIPLIVQSNAGIPENLNGEIVYGETPDLIKHYVVELIEFGANIIGGCCGTTPDHIKVIREIVDKNLT